MIAGIEMENGSCDPDHPLLGWFAIRRRGFDTVYLHATFEDYSCSRSRDIHGVPKI